MRCLVQYVIHCTTTACTSATTEFMEFYTEWSAAKSIDQFKGASLVDESLVDETLMDESLVDESLRDEQSERSRETREMVRERKTQMTSTVSVGQLTLPARCAKTTLLLLLLLLLLLQVTPAMHTSETTHQPTPRTALVGPTTLCTVLGAAPGTTQTTVQTTR